MSIVNNNPTKAFQLKGSLFTITVLQLFNCDKIEFQLQLEQMLKQAPKFFDNAPIVIDLNEFDSAKTPLDLETIIKLMREVKLIPFGIRGGDLDAQHKAIAANLAILHNSPNANQITKIAPKKPEFRKNEITTPKTASTKKEIANSMVHTKVITQPVRSGQQIYAKNSDLIILSAVSHGAEILADGHIHVYGPLRGRALAGIMGNTDARIFCRSLEAELVSIAGRYLINEQLDLYKNIVDLNIYLEEEQIKVTSIS